MTEKYWHGCKWSIETTRPTEPGLYRVLLAGFDDPNCPDYQQWATFCLEQDYKPSDEKDFFATQIPDGEPYLSMRLENIYEEPDAIIAWYGPVVIPDRETWNKTEEDKPETLPKEFGEYRVLIVGDEETDGPHVYYRYDDYECWALVKKLDEDGNPWIRCQFDEEPDWIIAWHGPINIPEVDCYS